MEKKYADWIEAYEGKTFRRCVEVSTEMQKAFPELRIARGFVQIIENGKWYQHQWCATPEGIIVDPTRNQWLGIIQYKEIFPEDPQPVGKCINCGEIVFSDSNYTPFCNKKCLEEHMGFMNRR